MQPIQISSDQLMLYAMLINIVLGFLFGTFPLLSGIILNNRKLGVYGFISSIIGGAVLGVFLSFPIAAVFTRLILKKSFAKEDDGVNADVNNTPAAGDIENPGNH